VTAKRDLEKKKLSPKQKQLSSLCSQKTPARIPQRGGRGLFLGGKRKTALLLELEKVKNPKIVIPFLGKGTAIEEKGGTMPQKKSQGI